jgi:hypothetical protein
MTKQHIIGTAISHTSVIVGIMYAFCIDEYVFSLKHCIDASSKSLHLQLSNCPMALFQKMVGYSI